MGEGGGKETAAMRAPQPGVWLRGIAVALPAVLALWFAGAGTAATSARTRIGAPAPVPPGTHTVGQTASSTQLRLTVVLAPQAGLAAYATAVSTPGSPFDGRFLSVSQFARRFGATPAHVAAVTSTLRAAGLKVGRPSANQLMIPVSGSAAQVEQAFSVSLARVKLSSGRIAYTNEQAPALPSSIASDVQGVVGLSDVAQYEPAQLRKPNPKQRLSAPRGAPGGRKRCNRRAAAVLERGCGPAPRRAHGG